MFQGKSIKKNPCPCCGSCSVVEQGSGTRTVLYSCNDCGIFFSRKEVLREGFTSLPA